MIEPAYVRMYVSDFVGLAARSEQGADVGGLLSRRIDESVSHAKLMDRHKGAGHLAALVERLHEESLRFSGRGLPRDQDPAPAADRHRVFLLDVARRLEAQDASAPETIPDVRVRPAGRSR